MKMFAWRSEALLVFFLTVSTANPLPRDKDGVGNKDLEQKKVTPVPGDDVLAQISNINTGYDIDGLVEVDIKGLTDDGVEDETEKPSFARVKRNANRNLTSVWQEKQIAYLIQSSLSAGGTNQKIQEAISEFHRHTCIRWVPWTNQPHFVFFIKQTGCWSYVGRQQLHSFMGSTYQTLSIGSGCEYKGIVMHEMMHVAGFWHEQSRPGRNEHIEVLWENVIVGTEHNFKQYSHRDVDNLNVQYDYNSILHYGNYAFTKNGLPTIRALADPKLRLGQRSGFSSLDIQELNALYDCNGPDGGWSSWSNYGPCEPVLCQRARQRFCTATDKSKCPGADRNGLQHERSACSPCEGHVDGGWGRWSSWSVCSATCGSGTKKRTRICDDPKPQHNGKQCIGDVSMASVCKDRSCNLGPGDCEFDGDRFCTWKQDTSDTSKLNWTRRHFYTPSSYNELNHITGPSSDHSTGTDYYIYSEASGVQQGATTGLLSQEFPSTSERCLTFWYYMYGADIGTLDVYTKHVGSGAQNKIWSVSGDQGKQWLQASITFTSAQTYQILLNAVCGKWYRSDIAVDDVRFNDGKCNPATTEATTTVPSISSTTVANDLENENCDFEKGFCSWIQSPEDAFDWVLKNGSTASVSTGPNQDCVTWPGIYAYFEASYPAIEGKKSVLISKEATPTSGRCLRFWYNMNGADQGKLVVYIKDTTSGALNKVWERTGDQGKIWHETSVSLISSSSYEVVLEAVRGKSVRGDIALDDITSTDGICVPPNGPEECRFDNDVETFCSWMQDSTDDFDWIRNKKSTPSSSTGPTNDHTIGTGYYDYFESTPAKEGQKSRLVSCELPATSKRCLTFWYNMHGDGMGKLKLYVKDVKSGTTTLIWERSGDQGKDWHQATVGSIGSQHTYQIVLEAERGTDYRSDIAVDDIVSYEGTCGDIEKTVVSQCNFDKDMCSYKGSSRQGSSNQIAAGPSSDHTSGSGSYVYLKRPLVSPAIDPQSTLCLTFWYQMFASGENMDCFTVRLRAAHDGALLQELWRENGGQRNQWIEGKVLFGSSSPFKLEFTGAHGNVNQASEIALDDVTVTKGLCTP